MAADYSTQRDALLARMRGRPDVEVWRAVTDLIARTFGITFVFKSVEALQAEGAGGYAQIALRRAHVPYITDARSFAIVLHEAGHILSEPCDPKAGHDARSDGRWWLCLRCERLAWDAARWQLFPSISRDMWDELRHGLTTYRRRLSSVTSPAEVARVDALTDRLAWHRHKNLQAKFELLRPR
jgi:hypothetical protein